MDSNPWAVWDDDARPTSHWAPTAPSATAAAHDDDEPDSHIDTDNDRTWPSSTSVGWTDSSDIAPTWGETSSVASTTDDTLDEVPVTSENPPSPPHSPDAFGTFETALETPDVDPWTPSQPFVNPESTSWEAETSWQSTTDDQSSKPDEWEAASRQKEAQDRFVPPELLASILYQFQSLSKDIWSSVEETEDTRNPRAVEDIEELDSSFRRFIPQDMTLPPSLEFSKTFTSKRLVESLKLTRHAPITRQSPFARYASSKGSTAWEASVKARPELQDDLVPAGWRMVPKDSELSTPIPDSKPKGGGLLSFFGRRASTPPILEKSPTSPVTRSGTASSSSSPRPSLETGRPSSRSSAPTVPSPLSPTTSVASSFSLPAPTAPPQPTTMPAREGTPLPSAVSRFLNRFSRTKSTTGSNRNSLALSSDDLEFLSDIVPSVSDGHDDLMGDSHDIKALTGMIGSSPLPTKLPPPLAPPPKAPPQHAPPLMSSQKFDDFSSSRSTPAVIPTQMALPSTVSDTPSLKPANSPTMSPMSPFTLPSPTLKSFTPAQKRIPTVIMSSRQASMSQLEPAFSLIPPPTSRERTPVSEDPPPTIHNPLPHQAASSMSLLDDDDFADFQDFMPPQSTKNASFTSSYADSSFTSMSSSQSLFSSTSSSRSNGMIKETDEDFDDFDDFVSPPTLRTPSPPVPPAKGSTRQHPPPKIELSAQLPVGSPAHSPVWKPAPPVARKPRAADHQRTLSLMESTATRKWPSGPPSPLPPLLPQPGGKTHGGFGMDIFGSAMEEQQLQAMTTSVSTPAMQFPAFESSPALKPTPPVTANSKPTRGGLSAQDLSFFEGL